MNLLEKNLEIIKNTDTYLYEQLIKIDIENFETDKVTVERAVDNSPIIKLNDGSDWYLDSKYVPAAVADDWVTLLGKIESTAVIVMYGFGSGSYLRELLKNTYNKVMIIVYEPDINIFLTVLKNIDLSFLEERVFTCVEGINDSLLSQYYVLMIKYSNMSVCKQVFHPNYKVKFKENIEKFLSIIKKSLTNIAIFTNTDIILSDAYYRCILNNLKYIPNASILEQAINEVGKSIPKDLPAIIVSAGPSLTKNIIELKKAKGKSFILATDTALRALFANDIIPDAFVVIDSHKSLKKFGDDRLKDIPVMCVETAQYLALDFQKGKKIFMNDTFGFGDEIYNELEKAYNHRDTGGCVATSAFNMVKGMGFKKIILLGQDLAYTDNRRHYGEGSREDLENNKKMVRVEDIYGDDVYTSLDYKMYLDWFEDKITKNPQIEVIDATEGGAKIHGSKIMKISDAIGEYCIEVFDMKRYLDELPPILNEDERKRAVEIIKKIPDNFMELTKKAKKGVELYKELISGLENKAPDTSKLLDVSREIGDVIEETEKMKEYNVILHKIKKIEYTTLNNLGMSLDDAIDDANEVAKRGIVMMDAVRQISEEALSDFETIVSEIN